MQSLGVVRIRLKYQPTLLPCLSKVADFEISCYLIQEPLDLQVIHYKIVYRMKVKARYMSRLSGSWFPVDGPRFAVQAVARLDRRLKSCGYASQPENSQFHT